jgi:hypothetical protein
MIMLIASIFIDRGIIDTTELYSKRDDINFPIVNFPFIYNSYMEKQ